MRCIYGEKHRSQSIVHIDGVVDVLTKLLTSAADPTMRGCSNSCRPRQSRSGHDAIGFPGVTSAPNNYEEKYGRKLTE